MLQSVQSHMQMVYREVEPYAMPAAVMTATALIINQLWGTAPAASFLGAATVIGFTFPHIITEISEQDFALGGARIVLMATLPFFGTWGIIASVCLATISSFTQDIRLYTIRSELKKNRKEVQEIRETRDDLIAKRESMVQECEAKLKAAEEYWKRTTLADDVKASIKDYGELIDSNSSFLTTLYQNVEAHNLVKEIHDLRDIVLQLAQKEKVDVRQ